MNEESIAFRHEVQTIAHGDRYRIEIQRSERFVTFKADWVLPDGGVDLRPIVWGHHDAGGFSFETEDLHTAEDVEDVHALVLVIFAAVMAMR